MMILKQSKWILLQHFLLLDYTGIGLWFTPYDHNTPNGPVYLLQYPFQKKNKVITNWDLA